MISNIVQTNDNVTLRGITAKQNSSAFYNIMNPKLLTFKSKNIKFA